MKVVQATKGTSEEVTPNGASREAEPRGDRSEESADISRGTSASQPWLSQAQLQRRPVWKHAQLGEERGEVQR